MWKLAELTFVYIFVSTGKFPVSTWKFPVSTLVGVFVGILWCVCTEKASTFVGISVDIFVYTLVGIFVSTFVREFVGQISRFACSVLFWFPAMCPRKSHFSHVFFYGCNFFAYSWKLPSYSWAFPLTVENFSVFTYNLEPVHLHLYFFLQLELFGYSKVHFSVGDCFFNRKLWGVKDHEW